MPYKFGQDLITSYSEIPQLNPLRWEILFKDGDTLHPQTGKFKCKDFLNDIVAARKGYPFEVYRFDSTKIKTNTEGVWFRLTNLADYQQFVSNINNTLNVFYVGTDKLLITIEQIDKDSAVVFLPDHFFSNTYKISLTSYIIRLCNYGVAFNTFREALESIPAGEDNPANDQGKQLALEWQLEIPDGASNYWYYCGKDHNSIKKPVTDYPAIIHNNGVYNWSQYKESLCAANAVM